MGHIFFIWIFPIFFFLLLPFSSWATTINVTTNADSGAGSLREAITTINADSGTTAYDIVFSSNMTISLSSPLPILNFSGSGALLHPITMNNSSIKSVTINGNGSGTNPIFMLYSGSLTLNSLTLSNGTSKGGSGGSSNDSDGGGGGGAGLGGALCIINPGTVNAIDCNFTSNRAQGGAGGSVTTGFTGKTGGGGGGGMWAGFGGGTVTLSPAGGGGGGGLSSAGAAPTTYPGGDGGSPNGGAGGTVPTAGGAGGIGGGGGGGGSFDFTTDPPTSGGAGGFGGGGGGAGGGGYSADPSLIVVGGAGGYGGGGGGSAYAFGDEQIFGGAGGTGGGGGGAAGSNQNIGAAGSSIAGISPGRGGSSNNFGGGGGGGGVGVGGAIFVQEGAALTLTNTSASTSFSSNSVTGGARGTNASAQISSTAGGAGGADIAAESTITFSIANGLTQTLQSTSGGTSLQSIAGISVTGPSSPAGTLSFGSGTTASYTTALLSNSATLSIRSGTAGTGAITFNTTGGTLQTQETFTVTSPLILNSTSGTATLASTSGTTGTFTGLISGNPTNGLTVSGPGTTALANASNTFTNGVRLTGGTLNINSNGALGTGSANISVINSATLQLGGSIVSPALSHPLVISAGQTLTIDTNGSNLTTTAAISGSTGALTKIGTGTLNVNTCTYGGATLLSAGTFQAGANNAFSSSSSMTISSGATLDLNNFSCTIPNFGGAGTISLGSGTLSFGGDNASSSFSGIIGPGTGGITKQGSGTYSFSGVNTYSGTTQIAGGTVALSSPGSFPFSSLSITNASAIFDITNATSPVIIQGLSDAVGGTISLGSNNLIFGTSASSTVASQITGTGGAIEKQGSGTVTLSGALSFTGATTIREGTLALSGTSSLESSSILQFNSGVNGFDISGISGTSTTLSNIACFGNSSTINLGSKKLVFGDSRSTTLSANIQGSGGSLEKQGAGSVTLTGTSTYTGTTLVSAGEFILNGSLAGAINVAEGANLAGTGTIGGNTTVNGTISPGDSAIGTLSIGGDLTLNSTSVTIYEISPVSNSLLSVSGTASLDGTAYILVDSGIYPTGTEFTLLQTSGGLTGTYNLLTFSKTMEGVLSYPAGSVLLTLEAPAGELSLSGLSGNSEVIANYINQLPLNLFNEAATYLTGLNSQEISDAMLAISPSRNSFSNYTIQNNAFILSKMASLRIDQRRRSDAFKGASQNKSLVAMAAPPRIVVEKDPFAKEKPSNECSKKTESNYELWLSDFGSWSFQDEQKQNPAFRSVSTGGLIGMDTISPIHPFSAGVMAGYLNSMIYNYANFGKQQIDTVVLGSYAIGEASNFFFEGYLGGSYNRTRSDRNIVFSGFNSTSRSKFNTWQILPHFKCGYDWELPSLILSPFASLDWPVLFQENYAETGAPFFNMQMNSSVTSFLQFLFALNGFHCWEFDFFSLSLQGRAGYLLRDPFSTGTVNAAIVGAPSTFQVVSFTDIQHLADISFDLGFQFDKGFIFFSTEGQFCSSYQSFDLQGGIGLEF